MFSQLSYQIQRKIILVCFLIVPLVLLCTFTFWPALNLFYYSMTSWDGIDPHKAWVGFANYKELFHTSKYFAVLGHQVSYLLVGIVQNILAIYFAVILNTKFRGRNVYRLILFLPFIMNGVAVSYMFQFVFDTTNGSLNQLLHVFGVNPISWLGQKSLVNYSLASIGFWRFMGYNMIVYLGALQAMPGDMYEAATIDGASKAQTFFYLTLPNLRQIIELNMFLTINGALSAFDQAFVLTNGGPAGASETFVTQTVKTAFQFNNFGLASALSVVLLLITVVVLGSQSLLLKGKEG